MQKPLPFPLRHIASVLYVILPELVAFVQYAVIQFFISLILAWLGLNGGGFARTVSVVWLIISAFRAVVGRRNRNERERDRKFIEHGLILEYYTDALASVSIIPASPAVLESTIIRQEKAVQIVMDRTGMNRKEIMNALSTYIPIQR